MGFIHIERVNCEQGFKADWVRDSSARERRRQNTFIEDKVARQRVVALVKSAAGGNDT
jgi:hypothetical protein